MKRLLSVVLVLPLTALAWADDDARPNTLTSQEIADGWILLFDGETTFGWTSPNESKWSIVGGMLAPQAGKPGLLVTTTAFGDYELSVEFQSRDRKDVGIFTHCDREGQSRGAVDALHLFPIGGWGELKARVEGGRVVRQEVISRGGLGGSVAQATKPPGVGDVGAPRGGHIALSGNGIVFRTIKLKPLGARPLFNGKDLAGWKEHPDRKSKFSVTKEGWLNIKDGPGDLQTEGQYADFVLQLDCISNGKQLNSGVFFRCRPGEYQQGYEAQIHNGFTDEPKKEYAIEVYDPKTNELKETKKEKYTATDYGTGGIYRRMPARKAVSKDNEWFTMTVAAQGRHLATWVNGVQVVDWTDNRPLKDNARNGCRLEKGNVSLQGHDPTTDLSFRNLRIAELAPPAKKEPQEKE
jgi:hypothetical protein